MITSYQDIPDTSFTVLGWGFYKDLKSFVNQELQKSRNDKIIGASLDAHVKLVCWNQLVHEALDTVSSELHFFFLVSSVEVIFDDSIRKYNEWGSHVYIIPSIHPKCTRCWHKNITVGNNEEHPELCERCIKNVLGEGEERIYF